MFAIRLFKVFNGRRVKDRCVKNQSEMSSSKFSMLTSVPSRLPVVVDRSFQPQEDASIRLSSWHHPVSWSHITLLRPLFRPIVLRQRSLYFLNEEVTSLKISPFPVRRFIPSKR